MIYQWKPGTQVKLPAQDVGERLETIREAAGHLTAAMVVEDARPARSLLHSAFEWNNAKAGAEYRLIQARELIRFVIVLDEDHVDQPPVRAFISITDLGEQSYTSTYVALADPELRAQVLRRAMGELHALQAKYRELTELAAVFAEIDKVALAS